jgi:hypothetical protein
MILAPPLDTVTLGRHGNALLETEQGWPPTIYCWPCDHYRDVTAHAILRVTFSWMAARRYPATRIIDYCHPCAVRFCRKKGIIPPEPRKGRGPSKNSLRLFQSCAPDDPKWAYIVARGKRIVKVGTKIECESFVQYRRNR